MNTQRYHAISLKRREIFFTIFLAGMLLIPSMVQGQGNSALLRGAGSRIRIFDGGPSNANADEDAYRVFQANEITVEAWVYPLFIDEQQRYIIRRPISRETEDNTYSLSIQNGEACFHISTGDEVPETAEVWSEDELPLFVWTHLAGTYDGDVLQLYINGGAVEPVSTPTPIPIGSNGIGFYLGRYLTDTFRGLIDDVRLWNVERTMTDIQDNMGNELVGNETGLVGYWKLNETTTGDDGRTVTIDRTDNYNDLEVQGWTDFVAFNHTTSGSPSIDIDETDIDFGIVEQASEAATKTIHIDNSGGTGPLVGHTSVEGNDLIAGLNIFYVEAGTSEEQNVTVRANGIGLHEGDLYFHSNAPSTELVSISIFTVPVGRIDINNIGMYVFRNGKSAHEPFTHGHGLEWPIKPTPTGQTAIYSAGIWIGATVGGEVRTAASVYNSEFSPGPIIGEAAADPNNTAYRVYKSSDPTDLAEWPGILGAPMMADGTTPRILGDQTLFTVYNDLDPARHSTFGTAPLGAEVQQTIFGFNRSGALGDAVFIRYKVINKGNDTWENAYLAVWNDPDLGDYSDDLVGIDISRDLGYVYNGADFDDDMDYGDGYGDTPPALGFDILQGALSTKPIQAFSYFTADGDYPSRDPVNGYEAFNLMRGLKSDGNPYIDPTSSFESTFPLNGDPVTPSGWVDSGPADRRFLISSGPFDLAPGESKILFAAIMVGQGGDRLSSITALREVSDEIQIMYDNGEIIEPFIVNSVGDNPDTNPGDGIANAGNGEVTLRAAIMEANAWPGRDLIHFNIPGTGVHTIQPGTTELPEITEPVIIDGYTQPGSEPATATTNAVLKIEIDGSNVTTGGRGLLFSSGGCTVRGLAINRFAVDGIYIGENCDGNIIEGNFLGTDASGTTDLGNRRGILMFSSDNTIGGTSPAARNLISGNDHRGISMTGTGNKIIGNYIGTNVTGTISLGNDEYGVLLVSASNNIIGPGNVISGNKDDGVTISGDDALENHIIGNFIGVNATGTDALGNGNRGVWLNAPDNIVGGSSAADRNVISGNTVGVSINPGCNGNEVMGNYIGTDITGNVTDPDGIPGNGDELGNTFGVFIDGGSYNTIGGSETGTRNVISGNVDEGINITGSGATDNLVLGNYIGIAANGTSALGNGDDGISIEHSSNNIIGGTESRMGNVISGNVSHGIAIAYSDATGNQILGNYIGTNASGNAAVPNGGGLWIGNGASDNIIGSMATGAGNVISGNTGKGITIESVNSTGNSILSNSIYSNGALGIDLNGANNLQNFPVLTSVEFGTGTVTIIGSLNSSADTDFTIQFFANKVADPSGYGEGQTYIGTNTVNTGLTGNATFTVTFPIHINAGQVISATTTDIDGNTSEFSASIGGATSQAVSALSWPLQYQINKLGHPDIKDGSDFEAIENAFLSWASILTATISFERDENDTDVQNASASDNINLVTFTDEEFPFAPGVLAVAAKTIQMNAAGGTAEIIDADIVFNPYWNATDYPFGTTTQPGYFDIQSVTTHEIGHILGMVHSGVVRSTMFYMLGAGTQVRTLETDDKAWASHRYPGGDFLTNYGSISGHIGDCYSITPFLPQGLPVAGALVLAISEASGDSVHAYSDENGIYKIPGLLPGNYTVAIEALDGDVAGHALRPGHISAYVYAIAEITDFPSEYYNDPDLDIETATVPTIVSVGPGVAGGINFVTNRDVTHPFVVEPVSFGLDALNVDVFPQIFIVFSEQIDPTTLNNETCYLTLAPSGPVVDAQASFSPVYVNLSEKNTKFIFTPSVALNYGTDYTLHITDGVTDNKLNPLNPVWAGDFKTKLADTDPPTVTHIEPADGADGILTNPVVRVTFSEPIDPATLPDGFSLSYIGSTGDYTAVTGSFDWQHADLRMTFDPNDALQEGTTYTVGLTSDIKDYAGNGLVEVTSTFATIAVAAPEIVSVGPNNCQGEVIVTTSIRIEFTEPMNKASIEANVTLTNGSDVPGHFTFEENDKVAYFHPESDLTTGATYEIGIGTDVWDVSDEVMQLVWTTEFPVPYTSTFITAVGAVVPVIDFFNPPSGVAGVEVVITGDGFSLNKEENGVHFSGVEAEVQDADQHTITVRVPQGATTGPISVTVVGFTATSTDDFYIVPPSSGLPDEVVANVTTGSNNEDTEATPDAAFAYVTNSGANTVTAIDLTTNQIVGEPIPVGTTPLKIAIHPDGTYAYITNLASHTVSVIDIDPASIDYNTVIATIPVGANPYGVAITSDGKTVYVANYTSENISVIDTDINSGAYNHIVSNISTGSKNTDMETGPDALRAFVAGEAGLLIIDTDKSSSSYNSVVANVETPSKTTELDVSPDAALVYAVTVDGRILIIDVFPNSSTYGQVVANVSTGSKIEDVKAGPDAITVYAIDDNDQLLVFKLTYGGGMYTAGASPSIPPDLTLTLVETFSLPEGSKPAGLAIDPKAEIIIVANSGTNDVAIINISPTASKTIGECIDEITALLDDSGTPKKALKDLENAKKHLGKALDDLEKGKDKQVFDGIKKAVKELEKAEKDGASVYKIINYLVEVARSKAQTALDEAKQFAGDSKVDREIEKAEKELQKAEDELDKGKLDKAIDHYKKAWEHSQKALKKAGVLGKEAEDSESSLSQNLPETYSISQNYPNPFNPSTTVHFEIPASNQRNVHVQLRVYNVMGQLIATLVDEEKSPGHYTATWDGRHGNGLKASGGIYLIRFNTGKVQFVRKVILLQ